jgi:hypothetical protein
MGKERKLCKNVNSGKREGWIRGKQGADWGGGGGSGYRKKVS